MRSDREDTTKQRDAEVDARKRLLEALGELAGEAALAQRPLRSAAKRPPAFDLGAVYAAVDRVRRAEEAADLAAVDVATASGADL